MRPSLRALAAALLTAAVLAGCQKPVYFPLEGSKPAADLAINGTAYDTDHDGRADFFTLLNADGRITRLGYETDNTARPDVVIDLDELPPSNCRHLVLILDGFGYDVVKRHFDAGRLRMFHPPSRVVAPYPTLTDPCLEDIFGYIPCRGMEAQYYDHRAGRIVGGSRAYLRGDNEPYNRLLNYRADMLFDALGYLWPRQVFGHELNDVQRLFSKGRTRQLRAYFVSSAGIGTRMGAAGQEKALLKVEQLINQVLWETHGLAKVTLLADHGHSYTPAKEIPLAGHLKGKGWRLTKRLSGDRDAVYIRFGLETYASFAAFKPADLAADVIGCKGVELASYVEGGNVVVLGADGSRATIRRKAGRYGYEAVQGDPLRLKDILARLQADSDGTYDAAELLKATVLHVYPAPLQRLWRAHLGLVENPPDVIASLADEYYSGSQAFSGFVNVASTHGGLNYRNSTAFIMSTIGPLPPVLQSRDIPKAMKELTGRDWPDEE